MLIGVSFRRGGTAAVETWQQHFDEDALSRSGFDTFVRIATCNRWEVVLQLPEGLDVDAARRLLTVPGGARPYAYVGEAALEHLALVASSLDSLNPGEDQIVQQIREAYREAQARGSSSSSLSFAFDTALRIAKRVRREVDLAPVNTSLFSLARPDLEAILAPGDGAVVVGAGDMGGLAAKVLAELEGVRLTVINRDLERARRVAEPLRAEARSLTDFLADPGDVRVLVCATPVRHLVGGSLLARLSGLELAVDLGLPPNVDPQAARTLGIRLLDIDALEEAGKRRRKLLGAKLATAEGFVLEELELALAAWNERQLAPSIRALQDWIGETIANAMDEMAAEGLQTLNQEDRERLARRVAHVPVKGLRALARAYGPEAARVFLAETGLAR